MLKDYDSINETPYVIGGWGEIRVEINFTSDRQDVYYNDVLFLSKGWTTGTSGGGLPELAAVDLYANGGSPVYWDDLSIVAAGAPPGNHAPVTPNVPSGEASGTVGTQYSYTTSTTDPDGDKVSYMWDWGDGNFSAWLGPSDSGATTTATYTWAAKGDYSIKVKARDTFGTESSWSDPLPITMPYTYNPILQFLELLLQRFPHAFPILRHLLGY
jgi:hypothetical protein